MPHSAYSVITLKVQSNHNSHSGRTRALSTLPMFAMFILSDFFTLYQSLDAKTNLNVSKRGLLIIIKKGMHV